LCYRQKGGGKYESENGALVLLNILLYFNKYMYCRNQKDIKMDITKYSNL